MGPIEEVPPTFEEHFIDRVLNMIFDSTVKAELLFGQEAPKKSMATSIFDTSNCSVSL